MKKIILFLFLSVTNLFTVFSAVTVVPANRTICGGLPTVYRPLGNIIISEDSVTDLAIGTNVTIVLTAPTNWQFSTTDATVNFMNGRNISEASIDSITNSSTITVTFTVTDTSLLDRIIISGVKIRAITGAVNGVITRTGGTATIDGNASGGGVNHGTLTHLATCVTEEIAGDICDAPVIPDTYCSTGNINDNTAAISAFTNGSFATSSCGNNRQYEVYYQFVATAEDYEVVGYAGTIGNNAEFTLLQNSTNCPTGTTWNFIDGTCPGWGNVGTFLGLTIGQTYFLAIDHSGNVGSAGTFDFCITPLPVAPPFFGTGKNCATAININQSWGLPFSHTHTMATGSTGDGNDWRNSCVDPFYTFGGITSFGDGIDMFYSYTVTGPTYITYELVNCTPNSFAVVSVLRECPSSATTTPNLTPITGNCVTQGNYGTNDSTHSIASSVGVIGTGVTSLRCTPIYLPTAGTYYFVVDNYPTPNSWTYTLNITDFGKAKNDECVGAISLDGGNIVSGNNAGCNYGWGPDDPTSGTICATSTENTAWFHFTALNPTVSFDFTNVSGQLQYGVFSGPCGGPYTKAGQNTFTNSAGINRSNNNDPCDTTSNNSTFIVTGLTVGNTYWLAVDGNGGTPSYFDIKLDSSSISGIYDSQNKLLDFNTKSVINGVLVSWASSDETSLDFYVLEKASNGKSFEDVTYKKCKGSSNSITGYTYLDNSDFESTRVYYRLKMVDKFGTESFSEILVVEFPGAKFEIVDANPNPFKNELKVVYTLEKQEAVDIKLFDSNAKKVFESVETGRVGTNNATVNTENLPKGIYYIIISKHSTNKQVVKKIVKE